MRNRKRPSLALRVPFAPTECRSVPGPNRLALIRASQNPIQQPANFLGHAGVRELVDDAPPERRGLRPLLVLHGDLELGAEVVAGLSDHAAGDFAKRLGFLLGEIGVELLEVGHGFLDLAMLGGIQEAAAPGPDL